MDEASQTAVMVAWLRGEAGERWPDVALDPFGKRLAGEEGHAYARTYVAAHEHAVLYLGIRTGFLDHAVRRAMDEGVTQVVLLGAGLDTRAARLARAGVRFFEVDHPKTQADKLARLARLTDYPADAAAMVACDLSTTDFVPLLQRAGFDTAAPAMIVWEGVVYYLTEDAVSATLERIARAFHPDTRLCFDTVSKRFVEGRVADARALEARSLVAQMGEPLRFGVDHPLPMLFDAGFRHVVSTTFDEACLTLTGTYDRERRFRFQALHEARVRRPRSS